MFLAHVYGSSQLVGARLLAETIRGNTLPFSIHTACIYIRVLDIPRSPRQCYLALSLAS